MQVKMAVWLRAAMLVLVSMTAMGAAAAQPRPETASVVMLSDLHFDPYHDPAKLSALRVADVSDWARIFLTPDSATQAADYASLQKACHARGEDSSWTVLNGSLQAARVEQPNPLFVTVSGDLLTHRFDCRMQTLAPGATPEDVSSFAAKTLAFLALELRETFPGAPVYLALGNNDSGCTDYHESPDSEFLRSEAEIAAGLFTKPRYLKTVLRAFSSRGDYSVLLPSPMSQTRLVILQDVFESPLYENCEGKAMEEESAAQIAWLRAQLVSARKDHQHVWVMAHIPPGVDEYASFHKYIKQPEKLCEVTSPTPMLNSDAMAQTLTEFAEVVRLGLFAHTHMDEMKLLHNASGAEVPVKLVPSISPVNGNDSAVTVAKVDTHSATLVDYSVFVASDKTASSWIEEYRYSSVYKMKDFSADSVSQLTASLAGDKRGSEDTSLMYQKWFFPGDSGDTARGLRAIWPAYACSTREDGGEAFHDCMCAAHTAQDNGSGSRQ